MTILGVPVDLINAISTIVVAVTAVVAIVLSVLFLRETRAARNIAQVQAYPRLFGPNGMILALRLENYGPAVARNVRMDYRLRDETGQSIGGKSHGQDVLVGGGHVTFLPDSAIIDKPSGLTLNELAERALVLDAEWSWQDDRRLLWLLPRTHRGRMSRSISDLHRDFYGGWSLYEPTADESLESISEELRELRKLAKKADERNRRSGT